MYMRSGIDYGWQWVTVWVDGQPLSFCVEADEDAGWAVILVIIDGSPISLYRIYDESILALYRDKWDAGALEWRDGVLMERRSGIVEICFDTPELRQDAILANQQGAISTFFARDKSSCARPASPLCYP